MTTGNETRRGRLLRGQALALAASLALFGACDDADDNDGADGSADGSDGTPDGSDGTPDGSDGTPDGSDGTPDGSDGTPDGSDGTPDAGDIDGGVELDAATPDAGEPDAGPDSVAVGDGTPAVIRLSATGHDRLYGVTYDAAGNIYATGQMASGTDAATDFSIVVAKFLPTGGLDATFGMAGVVTVNAAVGGKSAETGRGIVVQSTGNIVVLGAAEHDPSASGVLANDTDFVLVRLLPDGTLDAGFGTNGVLRHDFGTGWESSNTNGPVIAAADAPWSLGLADGDKLVVHGAARAPGNIGTTSDPRTDTDWLLARLGADGTLDTTFSDDGKVWVDIGLANASARSATVLADGSIVGSGYTTTDVLNVGTTTQQPVLYKVTSTGEFDDTFATADMWDEPGVYFDFTVAPPARAEAYGAALQGDHLVTMGYGPTLGTGTGSDFVSFRFSDHGALDTTYGTNGATWIDGGGYGDNGRALVVLPDQRVLGIGGGRPTPATPPAMGVNPPTDGMLVLLSEDGVPDADFGPGGVRMYDLNAGTGDFFWAGAVAPNGSQVAIVGLRGITGANDDAALLLLPLE